MKFFLSLAGICVGLALIGCGGGHGGAEPVPAPGRAPGPAVRIPKGPPPRKLTTFDLKRGSGKPAKRGDTVTIQYVGVHWNGGAYSNSWNYREAPTFVLGQHQLVRGFELGILGMKAGGRREVIVPLRLTNFPGVRVSPHAGRHPLVFVVDMLKVH